MTQVTLPSLGVLLAMVLIATVPVLHGVCVALRGGRHRPLRGGRPRPPAATGPAPFWVIVVAARGVKGLDAAVDAALALPRAFTAVLVADLADGRDVIDAVTRRANPRVGLVRPRGAGDDAARLLALLHDVAHGPEAPRRRHDDVVVGVIGPGDTVTAATLVDVAARFADARVAVVWPRRGASGASGSRRWLAALDAAAYVGAAGGRASDLSDLGRRPCFVRLSGLPGGGGRPGGPTRHTGGGAAVVRGDAGPRDGFDDRVRRVARRFGDLARATRTGDAAPADVATALAATVPALAAGAGLAATALGAALAVGAGGTGPVSAAGLALWATASAGGAGPGVREAWGRGPLAVLAALGAHVAWSPVWAAAAWAALATSLARAARWTPPGAGRGPIPAPAVVERHARRPAEPVSDVARRRLLARGLRGPGVAPPAPGAEDLRRRALARALTHPARPVRPGRMPGRAPVAARVPTPAVAARRHALARALVNPARPTFAPRSAHPARRRTPPVRAGRVLAETAVAVAAARPAGRKALACGAGSVRAVRFVGDAGRAMACARSRRDPRRGPRPAAQTAAAGPSGADGWVTAPGAADRPPVTATA